MTLSKLFYTLRDSYWFSGRRFWAVAAFQLEIRRFINEFHSDFIVNPWQTADKISPLFYFTNITFFSSAW